MYINVVFPASDISSIPTDINRYKLKFSALRETLGSDVLNYLVAVF